MSSGLTRSPSAAVAEASEDDDQVLIGRVAARDRGAFETLYRRYGRRLHGYLTRILRRPEVVEEVLDDTMVVVWQNAARYNGTARLSSWMFGIAHHKALKALRAKPGGATELPLAEDDTIAGEGPEDVAARGELRTTLDRALAALPLEQRAVVELTFYHECSYKEIAEITGSPVNTVKTRMFHARRRLAAALGWLAGPSTIASGEGAR
jgi:RNA polymerase sigma-70 factor (ECF subfamily)